MRICLITDNKKSYSTNSFLKEARLAGKDITLASWQNILFNSDKNSLILNKKIPLNKFNAVILRSSKTSLTPSSLVLDYCEHNNIRLLNKCFYLRYQSVNKLRQQVIFKIKKIPYLKTLYGENLSFGLLKKELGIPFVAKFAQGSLGKQVFKISSLKEFSNFIIKRKLDKQLYLFQKFYKTDGDYRVFIVGEKVFGPVKRIAPEGEWKTNIRGTKHKRAEQEKRVLNFAKKIIEKTSLEFAGLDILIDSTGKPRLIEINTMACFKIFDKIYPEINIAKKTIALFR